LLLLSLTPCRCYGHFCARHGRIFWQSETVVNFPRIKTLFKLVQSNSIIKQIHQVVCNMICVKNIRDKNNLDKDFGWTGVLSPIRQAVHSLVCIHYHLYDANTASVQSRRTAQYLLLPGRLGLHQGTKATSYPPKQQEGKCKMDSYNVGDQVICWRMVLVC
jgi:hypothetical protein